MNCKICNRGSDYLTDGLCIWCEIFGTMKVHGKYTFPNGGLTISTNFNNLPSHMEERFEIKRLQEEPIKPTKEKS